MSAKYINLACGPVFIGSPDWANFDFVAASGVQQVDLLGRLPLTDNFAKLVYSSHFLEHIPKPQVESFLREFLRVLQPGGVIRLVLPDLENMARTYLQLRDEGKHDKADFLVLEMIDQCVRRQSGGELGKYYRTLQKQAMGHLCASGDNTVMVDFIRYRTGEHIGAPDQSKPAAGGGLEPSSNACSEPFHDGYSVIGFKRFFMRFHRHSARKMSAWPGWARSITGSGTSTSCSKRSKRWASFQWCAVQPTAAQLEISHFTRWISTQMDCRAKGPSRCISRRASHSRYIAHDALARRVS